MSAARALRLLCLAAAALTAPPAAGAPARIVSINVCADQLVLMLADRGRIASLSALVRDPTVSAMAREAGGIPVNHGLAEEVMRLAPDLVVASAFATRPTVSLLRRLGYKVLELPIATRIADIRANVAALAGAIGEPARGRALIARLDAGLARWRPPAGARRPLAALYQANGYTPGPGTLADAVAVAAGFRTLGGVLGIRGMAQVPLETLLAARPDLLVLGLHQAGASLAEARLRHPALRALAARRSVRIDDALWVCGTPRIVDALARLAEARVAAAAP